MAIIYGLFHIASGRAYIGSTEAKLAKRFREHRCLLNNGKHTSRKIQSDWSLYGAESFEIRALQDTGHNTSKEARRAAEQRWMDKFKADGLLYNSYDIAFGIPRDVVQMGIEASRKSVGNRWSDETNRKRSLAQIGRPKGHGAKISATKRAKRAKILSGR